MRQTYTEAVDVESKESTSGVEKLRFLLALSLEEGVCGASAASPVMSNKHVKARQYMPDWTVKVMTTIASALS